jgi:two-component system, NarL family, sensor kinase
MDEKEKSFYTAILIVSAVVGVIITYFIISIIRQQRRTVRLYKQSLLTEITTLEKERSRMASDLHDEVGPLLSAIKLRIGSLDVSEADEEEVEKTDRQIDNLIKRMREISFDLMPTSLIRKGLTAALSEFIDYCSKSSPLKIHFQHKDIPLSQPQAINMYRIVQEIIHNTIKHAGASQLLIELRQEKDKVVLATRDNGKGFNYEEKSSEAKGLGLQNLSRRAEIIGGKMFFESKKERGTTYIFEIPIVEDEKRKSNQNYSGG